MLKKENSILVKPHDVRKSESGLLKFIKENTKVPNPNKGMVLSVHETVKDVSVGDTVYFDFFKTKPFGNLLILKEEDVKLCKKA